MTVIAPPEWRKTVSTACGKIKAEPAPAPTAAPCRHIASPTTGRPNPSATSSDPSNPDRTPAQADDEEELELNYEENDSAMYGVHRTFQEGTPNGATERLAELHHLTTAATEMLAHSSPASKPEIAANLASLTAESHQLRKLQRISIQLERHPSQPTPTCKGKTATTAKIKKKRPRGRSRSQPQQEQATPL
eukprot:jgi/Tetstr1/423076/TSEL_013847.t1